MKCANCGKEFTPNKFQHGKKYCSSECSDKAWHAKQGHGLKKKNCPNCGEEFMPKNGVQKFCSAQCRNESKEKRRKLK